MERPLMEADVVIVGAGPAGLACALRLCQLIDSGQAGALSKDNILVLEKAREVGAHMLSGAVLDPRALAELLPDFAAEAPLQATVGREGVFLLSSHFALPFPFIPPPLKNHGNFVVSLNQLVRWLGEKVEAQGVTVFTSVAGRDLLFDESGRVNGIRTDDKGLDRTGQPKSNFEPGSDIRSKIVILAEGPRGSLTRQLHGKLALQGRNPQVFGLGVKELWQLPDNRFPAGQVFHTMGWPIPPDLYGGGWLYGLPQNRLSLGLVTGLEYTDPSTDPHTLFQAFKTHPMLRRILQGGEMLRYGAKVVPLGGWYAIPPNAGAGWLVIGDSGGYLNPQRLKGIHLAIKSGMLAAETVVQSMNRGDLTQLESFDQRMRESWAGEELRRVRNFHQGFEHGLWPGLAHAGLQTMTGGRGLREFYPATAGHTRMQRLDQLPNRNEALERREVITDRVLTFNKLDDVYYSGTRHEEDQPPHLLVADTDICSGRCVREYGNPCQHFCPAQVYEMAVDEQGIKRLKLNPSNCVHCKTCDIMDPYQIITWVPPEGGGGPSYDGM